MAKSKKDAMTVKDVCDLFGCTPMTVFNYRNGVGKTLKSPLPHKLIPKGNERHSVAFKRTEVLRWAKKNSIPVYAP